MGNTRKVLLSASKGAGLCQLSDEESQRLKENLLEMYKDILEFCEKHQICFMLGGGSVLGCVRHAGFIPWDDDLDLMMDRENYDKFTQTFEKSMGDKYELFVPDGKHKITHLFMKVSRKGTIEEDIYTAGSTAKTGIAIDIFPMEHVPRNLILRVVKGFLSNVFAYTAVSIYMFQNRNQYMKEAYQGTIKGRINYYIRMVLGALFSFRSYEKWYQDFDKFAQTKKDSGLCTIPTGRNHYNGEIQHNSVFFPPKVAEFEGIKAYIPREVDVYLKDLFGNYMDIPPVEQREKHFYTRIEF